MNIVILIPAYNPPEGLPAVIAELRGRIVDHPAFAGIVVVNDGSGAGHDACFAAVEAIENVRVLRHAVNLGKGAALKTGINNILVTYGDDVGIVTADADGQHAPDDIRLVMDGLLAQPGSLILGSRSFGSGVPLRSRIGNILTQRLMWLLTGINVADTQTGLRGIPGALLPHLLRLPTQRYEFELDMLLRAHQIHIPLRTLPIRTIYLDGNASSHFNPFLDSARIYFVLLRGIFSSLLSAVIDNFVFIIAFASGASILFSQVLGRVFSLAVQYFVAKNFVFHSDLKDREAAPKYIILVIVSGILSYASINLLISQLYIEAVAAKLISESVIFIFNFAIQRNFIFMTRRDRL